jgi:cytochrome c553
LQFMIAEKKRRSRSIETACCDGSLLAWLLLALTVLVVLVMFAAEPAIAQTRRSVEVLDRALELEPDTIRGRASYQEHCAGCHGVTAHGDAAAVVPALAGQLPIYIIEQLANIAEGQRTAPEMHRVVATKAMSTPQALSDVAGYLGSLDRNEEPEHGEGTKLAIGKRKYQALCSSCHGRRGAGHPINGTPALRGQNYAYLLMRMRDIATGHGATVDVTVAESLEQLTYDELTALADYTSRL